MSFYQFVRLLKHAFYNIRLRLGRSILTSLGIIIGTSTIVIVIALGLGAQEDIRNQYSNLSVTSIFIFGQKSQDTKLSIDDVDIIMSEAEHVVSAVPQISGKVTVVTEDGVSDSYNVVGTVPQYAVDLNLETVYGEFFNDTSEYDAVLGYNVAEELYGNIDSSIVGQEIRIGRKIYNVVAVLSYRGGSIGQTSIDDSIYIPYDNAERYILRSTGKFMINAMADSPDNIDLAIEELREILRNAHNLKDSQVDDFRIKDMGTMVSSAVDSAKTMTFLLSGVALIVLIVGGIGIMNIMLVSVQERTKEIGIRKAIGAKPVFILTQFLLESFILSLLSALVGCLIAVGVIHILDVNDISVVSTVYAYIIASVSSLLTGLFFGFYPARMAASQDPIESLRTS